MFFYFNTSFLFVIMDQTDSNYDRRQEQEQDHDEEEPVMNMRRLKAMGMAEDSEVSRPVDVGIVLWNRE